MPTQQNRLAYYLPQLPARLGATSTNWHLSRRTNERLRCGYRRSMRMPLVFMFILTMGLIALYAQLPQRLLTKWALPLYEEYRNREDHLPHYSLDSPYPNGRHAKFILFSTHQRGNCVILKRQLPPRCSFFVRTRQELAGAM